MSGKQTVGAAEFWDNIFAQGSRAGYSTVSLPDDDDPVVPALHAALEHFGDVRGKTILDLGCGRGATSLFLASRGAHVVAVDISPSATENLRAFCAENGIDNVTPVCMEAMEIGRLDRVDFAFGSMILHHIEPFAEFAELLRGRVRPGGRGFFWENNARSELMIWFRQNVVGRFGVPKYGDDEEFPLTPGEVGILRRHFRVELRYPELYFFRMIPPYLLRGRFEEPFARLDRAFYRFERLRQYTYRQYVLLS
ncbi:MAG TPA: class I SAM-dependent methyltransferase [Longimicrobiaceae bacterium]|nr:class I SAM-dependent methyltransferase [Longimicrobiaceae bacterium]